MLLGSGMGSIDNVSLIFKCNSKLVFIFMDKCHLHLFYYLLLYQYYFFLFLSSHYHEDNNDETTDSDPVKSVVSKWCGIFFSPVPNVSSVFRSMMFLKPCHNAFDNEKWKFVVINWQILSKTTIANNWHGDKDTEQAKDHTFLNFFNIEGMQHALLCIRDK